MASRCVTSKAQDNTTNVDINENKDYKWFVDEQKNITFEQHMILWKRIADDLLQKWVTDIPIIRMIYNYQLKPINKITYRLESPEWFIDYDFRNFFLTKERFYKQWLSYRLLANQEITLQDLYALAYHNKIQIYTYLMEPPKITAAAQNIFEPELTSVASEYKQKLFSDIASESLSPEQIKIDQPEKKEISPTPSNQAQIMNEPIHTVESIHTVEPTHPQTAIIQPPQIQSELQQQPPQIQSEIQQEPQIQSEIKKVSEIQPEPQRAGKKRSHFKSHIIRKQKLAEQAKLQRKREMKEKKLKLKAESRARAEQLKIEEPKIIKEFNIQQEQAAKAKKKQKELAKKRKNITYYRRKKK